MAKVSINGYVIGIIEVTREEVTRLQTEGFVVEVQQNFNQNKKKKKIKKLKKTIDKQTKE